LSAPFPIERGKTTFGEVVEKFLLTIRDQSASTQQNKEIVLKKALADWDDAPVRDLKKSDLLKWLAGLGFGASWRNQHLRVLRAVLLLAVDDGILFRSQLEGVKEKKVPKPIRPTPSHAEFAVIVESIRT
jgi:hypothetical protein